MEEVVDTLETPDWEMRVSQERKKRGREWAKPEEREEKRGEGIRDASELRR